MIPHYMQWSRQLGVFWYNLPFWVPKNDPYHWNLQRIVEHPALWAKLIHHIRSVVRNCLEEFVNSVQKRGKVEVGIKKNFICSQSWNLWCLTASLSSCLQSDSNQIESPSLSQIVMDKRSDSRGSTRFSALLPDLFWLLATSERLTWSYQSILPDWA